MLLVAIDGGSGKSAVVVLRCKPGKLPEVMEEAYLDNEAVEAWLRAKSCNFDVVVYEAIVSYGGAGAEVIQTAYFNGRFHNCVDKDTTVCAIERRTVKKILFGSVTGNDSAVRKHILAMYGQKSTTGKNNPLEGITSHKIQAMAVGITYNILHEEDRLSELWDPHYTDSDAFADKRTERRVKNKAKTERKAKVGDPARFSGKLKE